MSADTLLETLQDMDFGQNLKPEHLEKLAAMATEVEFPANATIFHEGELSDKVYLIVDGRVAVEIFVPSRGRVTILTLRNRQTLGWSPIFENKPNTASGRAMVPTKTLALNAKQLRTVCQEDHELGCALGWRVAETIAGRLKATRLQLLDIFATE
jgi:CRP-like cAMP-binding protein